MKAFSVIELLVSIAVMAIILSLVLPSLSGTIDRAKSIGCLANLSNSHKSKLRWAIDHDDLIPTPFWNDRESERAEVGFDQINYLPRTADAADLWFFVLGLPNLGGTKPQFQAYSCPVVYNTDAGISEQADVDSNPHLYVAYSYFGSAVLTTDPELWASSDESVRRSSELTASHRRAVRLHNVRRPAQKVWIAERSDFHGSPIWSAVDPEYRRLNALFLDGHVAAVQNMDVEEGHRTSGFGAGQSAWSDPDKIFRVPFLATRDGYLGADVKAGGS